MTCEHDELIDLVDGKDRVIRPILKTEFHATKPGHFRSINAFIVNDQGQIWIPRRTAHKTLFPSALDVSVGGHVQSGETYSDAFLRESLEEVNANPAQLPVTFLGYLTPHLGLSAFMHVYLIRSNVTPAYNIDDFCESSWFYPNQIIQILQQGEKAKGDLLPLIKHFFAPVAQ